MSNIEEISTSFSPNGIKLDAIICKPSGAGSYPIVILIHGFGAVKEMSLIDTARVFAQNGYLCVAYDHRNLGKSGGEIRQEIDPWEQIKDLRGVITCAQSLPEVDSKRIALWGTSFAAGEVIVAAAADRRVKAVIAQVPFVSGSRTIEKMYPAALMPEMLDKIYAEKIARSQGSAPALVPISDEGTDGNLWAKRAGKGTAYQNAMTLQSFDNALYFEPIDFIHRIAPTPLLMMIAKNDTRTPTELQIEAYEKAREPKELLWLEGGHYDPYEMNHEICSNAAVKFLDKVL